MQAARHPMVPNEATSSNNERAGMKRQKKSVVKDLHCLHRQHMLRTGRRCALSPLDPFGPSNFIALAEDIEPHSSSPIPALESMLDGSEDDDAGEASNPREYVCGHLITTTEEAQPEDEPLQFQFDLDVVETCEPFFVKPIECKAGRQHDKIRH